IEGKDAGLTLLRDITVNGKYADLLDHVVVLFLPIFNVDGHERFGPYNRANQNGPTEMGWRTTAQNLNLNRDFLKADAPEMRAWLEMFNFWLPDLLVDIHASDGADYQYVITYALETNTNVAPPLATWSADIFEPALRKEMTALGFPFVRYIVPKEGNDVTSGLMTWTATPRFSNGYGAIQNRPFLLIETHMLKDYRTRVNSVYALFDVLLNYCNANFVEIQEVVSDADRFTAAELPDSWLPLSYRPGPDSTPVEFLGVDFQFQPSEITGADLVVWGTQPMTYQVPAFYQNLPTDSVLVPHAYLVPREWQEQLEVLQLHGVDLEYLAEPTEVEVESYRFTSAEWEAEPYESHHRVSVEYEPFRERRNFPAGTAVVLLNQRTNRVAVHLLEPKAPDSFVRWGFFDAIFERKEYIEDYVMEPLARQMLAEDSTLQAEFQARLDSDSAFAASPEARLDFFYERTPYYDQMLNLYPVGRILDPVALELQ
ncbi:MAG: M14 family metallopeptidase, partial [bacterium]